MNETKNHPAHPVRNFLYAIWSLVNALAFAGFFFALATRTLPYRPTVILGCATLMVIGAVFGFFRPLLKRR